MRGPVWLGTVLLALLAAGQTIGGEPSCCPPPGNSVLGRIRPVGGWFPYGGGLLRWWPRCCFPCCGGPDDYCRKPLPPVCRPPYPPFYTWGPPQGCCPQGGCADHAPPPPAP